MSDQEKGMTELLEKLGEQFPSMESVVVFSRDPKTGQLLMSPLFKIPEDGSSFLLSQSERFQEYARGLSHLSLQFHKLKFKQQ